MYQYGTTISQFDGFTMEMNQVRCELEELWLERQNFHEKVVWLKTTDVLFPENDDVECLFEYLEKFYDVASKLLE